MKILKAAVHLHSDWSYDGHFKLKELVDFFDRFGVRILLMAEHDRNFTQEKLNDYICACEQYSTDRCLIVPGIEYSDKDNDTHVLTWGDLPFFGENLPTLTLLENVNSNGGVCVLAHPSRGNTFTKYEYQWEKYLSGIEVWNRKTDGFQMSREALILFKGNPDLIPFVSLDFHNKKQFIPLFMKIKISGYVNSKIVIDAMRSRYIYPSVFGFHAKTMMNKKGIFILNILEKIRKSSLSALRSIKK